MDQGLSRTSMELQMEQLETEVRRGLSDGEQVHLEQIEYRIHDHRERFTGSLLEIGRLLNECKDAKLVGHGHWQDWVSLHTGFSLRGAQRVMRAAREIPKASALSLMDFSKAYALLALPAEEREDFARETDAEHISLRQLEEAICDRRSAEKRAQEAEERERRAEERAEELAKSLEEATRHPVVQEVVPEDYERLKRRDADAAARIREAEDYAEEQEQRVRELQSRLDDAVARAGSEKSVVREIVDACTDFYSAVGTYSAASLRSADEQSLRVLRYWLASIALWLATMEDADGSGACVEVTDDD